MTIPRRWSTCFWRPWRREGRAAIAKSRNVIGPDFENRNDLGLWPMPVGLLSSGAQHRLTRGTRSRQQGSGIHC